MLARLFLMTLMIVSACTPVLAETVIASRMIRSQSILMPSDVNLSPETVPGALTSAADAVGMEARVNLYEGRPVRPEDLGPPAIIERNQLVKLNYHHAGLAITTEGRSLGRGGVGENIRIMNLTSRTTVSGVILVDGSVTVAPATH